MSAPVQVIAAKHLIDKGLPLTGAVSLTCVLYFESKLNPGSQGVQGTETPGALNPRGAYGIASWNGPRQQSLKDYCDKRGLPYDNLQVQLDFVLNEIANHYPASWAAIRSASPCQAIITALVDEYENPKDKPREIAGALGYAGALLEEVKGYAPGVAVPTAPPRPVPSIPSSPPIPIGDLQMPIELILQLVAPLAESLVAGLLKGVLTHVQQSGTMPAPGTFSSTHVVPAPAAPVGLPPIDFAALAKLIAAELAMLNQQKPAA